MTTIPDLTAAQAQYDAATPLPSDRDTAMRVGPHLTADEQLMEHKWRTRRAILKTLGVAWNVFAPSGNRFAVEPLLFMGLGDLAEDRRELARQLRELADAVEGK